MRAGWRQIRSSRAGIGSAQNGGELQDLILLFNTRIARIGQQGHSWFYSPDPIPDTGCIKFSSTCKVWCDLGFDWGDCWAVGTKEDCELTCRPMHNFNGYCVPLGNPDVEGKGCWGCSDMSSLTRRGGGSKPIAPFNRVASPNTGNGGGGGGIDCWSVCVEYQSGQIDLSLAVSPKPFSTC